MIIYVSMMLYPDSGVRPYVAIGGSDRLRTYCLTRASAERLARACREIKGELWVDGQGWLWKRTS